MAKELPLVTNRAQAEGQRKRTINRTIHIGPVSMRILTIASLASLLLFYLAQTTQSATKSYEVQALQQTAQELVDEQDRLGLEAQRLQSLAAIKEGIGAERLEADFDPVDTLEKVE